MTLTPPWAGRCGLAFAFALLTNLAACGGGGGGDSGSASPSGGGGSFRVSLNKTRIAFEFTEGSGGYAVPPEEILASAEGTVPNPLYVLATTDGVGLSPNIPTQISYDGARFRVWPADNLPAGTYSGKLNLYACADEACKQTLAGTPKTVDYSVRVHRRLAAQAPAELSVVSGEVRTFELPVTLPDNATGVTAWVGDDSRLKVGTPIGNQVPVTLGGPLKSGLYTDYISLACTGTCTQVAGVAITYEVKPPAGGEHGLIVAPSSLSFSTTEGAVAPSQAVQIDLPTWGGGQRSKLTYTPSDRSTWLQAVPTATGLTVTASGVGLRAGTYNSSVYITEPATGLTHNLYASLTVGVGLVQPANLALQLTADSRPQDLQWQVPVRVNGGPDVTYTASVDQPWLQLPQAQGRTGQDLTVRVDPLALQRLGDSGRAFGTVVLRPTSGNYSPIQFTVVADVKLPRLDIVAPQLLMANQAQTVRLRGNGLADVSRLSELLRLDGQPLPSPVVRSGDAFVVPLPALSAGSHELRLTSDTGLAFAPLTLRTVAPVAIPFAALAPIGTSPTLFYDAWRKALYSVDVDGAALRRHAWSGQGSRWSVSRQPDLIQAAGPMPGGDTWMVVTRDGTTTVVDADTWATRHGPFNWSLGNAFRRPHGPILMRAHGLATYRTEMGGLFGGGVGAVSVNGLSLTGQVGTPLVTSDLKGIATLHEQMLVTADGERALFFRRDGPYGPSMFLSPALNESLRQVTGLVEGDDSPNALLAMSANGDRTLTAGLDSASLAGLRTLTVWNRDFTQRNEMQWWDTGGADQVVGAALSPDGRRAYVITHPMMDSVPQVATLHVFDTGSVLPAFQVLTPIGSAELPTLADCAGSACQSDWPRLAMTVSMDGKTLFASGRTKLLVLPIPAEDTLVSANSTRVRAAAVRSVTPKAVRWR